MTTAITADTTINFRYLSEPDMIAAGVQDIARCVDVMEETLILLNKGDYMM
ncbi:MAG: ornithine cyclodeaminase, partial [Corynebacterium variabile]|nr:ornithine cyclodeaminase [Corynebacterium variabile]